MLGEQKEVSSLEGDAILWIGLQSKLQEQLKIKNIVGCY